jgi:hypothetical protein
MSDEKKDSRHTASSTESEGEVRGHPETNFLPPLKMFLAFFDKEARQKKKKKDAKQEDSDEKNVEKLIEKLSETEEESDGLSSSKGKK